jgi:hypothetical protein
VTIGHGALLTSCTVGDRSLIGQGAVVQEGCEIGSNSIVAAGAVVLPGATRWLLLFVVVSCSVVSLHVCKCNTGANTMNSCTLLALQVSRRWRGERVLVSLVEHVVLSTTLCFPPGTSFLHHCDDSLSVFGTNCSLSSLTMSQRRHDCAQRAAVGRQPRRLHPRRVRGRDRRLHQGKASALLMFCGDRP